MSSYKNKNENNVQINPKILSLVYTTPMAKQQDAMTQCMRHVSN